MRNVAAINNPNAPVIMPVAMARAFEGYVD